MSNWYKWESIESFNTWHTAIKIKLGLPKSSITEDGLEVIGGVITDKYTNPITVAENDIRAVVDADHAEGLILSEDPNRSNY